jgi:glycerol-3-phosphate dehydrogenase
MEEIPERRCDVLVIGGGIAGALVRLSCSAER